MDTTTPFIEKLQARVETANSLLCVGLDPHGKELQLQPEASEEERCDAAFSFCKTIIDATAPHAACYKPNAAFFEALGDAGAATLVRVLREIPSEIPVLLDVKRGDIGSTAAAYADACYGHFGVDAVTLSPLMGWDSVEPFVTGKYTGKGAFLLCKTSNPGSKDILALNLSSGETLFQRIAKLARDWSSSIPDCSHPPLGLVVGATDSDAMQKVRSASGDGVWILAPGVGFQGGDLKATVQAGLDSTGSCLLVPVSRGISQAADKSAAAKDLKEAINSVRGAPSSSFSEESPTTPAQAEVPSTPVPEIKPYQQEFLEFSLAQGVLKFGSFVLKSGRTSPYFFNAGLFATGSALYTLGASYAAAIMASEYLTDGSGGVNFDVIFGPAYKGISLGAVVCAALYQKYGIDVGFSYNRKEAKSHGEGGTLVGASMEGGKRVLVVDDVITAGTAIRESHTMLQGIGAKMVGVCIALDRAEKRSLEDPVSAVQAVERDLAVSVTSIASLPQLQAFLEKDPQAYGEDTLKQVKDYRAQYGV